jgi:hypothetical protein
MGANGREEWHSIEILNYSHFWVLNLTFQSDAAVIYGKTET